MCVRFSQLDGATVGVWGAGREIRSFAAQLARRLPSARIAVAVFDGPPPQDLRETLAAPELSVVDADRAVQALAGCDVLVRSPGVSVHRPQLRALRGAGVHVTTATALWLAEREGRGVIGITGTKGKSTTAALVVHLARAAGRAVHLAGNIGVPALDLLDHDPTEMAVVELSSYQIADLRCGPQIAVITSLFPEHIDWHGSFDAYREDKLRILGLPGVQAAVLNGRSEQLVATAAARGEGELIPYGVTDGYDIVPLGIARGGELVLERGELPLRGEHNALNLCAALAALEAFGVALASLPDALQGFRALPHRLETVAERGGVLWVNDSISTTPESTIAALESFAEREILLIGGGQDRGQDYAALARRLAETGAGVVGIPSTGPRLIAEARRAGVPAARALEAADLRAAIALARTLAGAGTTVLLSPAAASYDHYRDFEERGELFRALVDPA
jgi:UDP-N-acetylmuramoyl-L-alanine---L-glutamate ligase